MLVDWTAGTNSLFHHRHVKPTIRKGQASLDLAFSIRLWLIRVELAGRGFQLTAPANLQLHLSNTLSVDSYLVKGQPAKPAGIA